MGVLSEIGSRRVNMFSKKEVYDHPGRSEAVSNVLEYLNVAFSAYELLIGGLQISSQSICLWNTSLIVEMIVSTKK